MCNKKNSKIINTLFVDSMPAGFLTQFTDLLRKMEWDKIQAWRLCQIGQQENRTIDVAMEGK